MPPRESGLTTGPSWTPSSPARLVPAKVNVDLREPGASFAQRLLDANEVRMGDTDGQRFAEISVLTTGKAVVKRTLEACGGGADN